MMFRRDFIPANLDAQEKRFGLCMLNCDVEMMSNQDGLMMVLCRARGKISPF